jgi:hypothetical protein
MEARSSGDTNKYKENHVRQDMGWQMENIMACSYIQFKVHFLFVAPFLIRK